MNSDDLLKIRRANVRNILARVRDGKPLTTPQLEVVRQELENKSDMPEPKTNLSAQEFANLVNLDKRRVQQLAKEGVIIKEGRGLYPISEVTAYVRYLQEIVQQRKIQPDHEEGDLNPEQEMARKNKELADKTALENRVKRDELVEASEIDSAWTDIALAIRSKLLGIGSKLAPVLVNHSKPATIKKQLDIAMRQVLEELSKHNDEIEHTDEED